MAYRRVKVEGTDELRALSVKLKAAGDRKTLNALRSGIRAAAKPAVDDAAQAVENLRVWGEWTPAHLRHNKGKRRTTGVSTGARTGRTSRLTYDVRRSRGNLTRVLTRAAGRSGLRQNIARALTVQMSSGRGASVRIKVDRNKLPEDQRRLPNHLEKGKWRHPTFGNEERWVTQFSAGGWFYPTLRRHQDRVRESINNHVKAVLGDLR